LDERTNNRESAAAAVKGAEAAVESAEIDLDYAHVKAPISGKISRAEITEGNLVQAGGNAPVLTSIVADDKVYVDFEVDERTYIESVKSTQNKDVSIIPVRVKTLGAESEYQGTVHSFDNHIDTASGTVRARAIFDNKDGVLLPGMSVSVLMGTADGTDKILVTERAIGTDQDRKFVYVIGDDQTAQYREVKIGESVSGQRVIISGLEEGENIISAGIVRIRPGMPVMPKTAEQAE
ncbi:MAG: efflux RND transporter periplasmic adaptor subunit, partial [Pseudomonadota bacterium]|nr:efflux RND transporter periplasmic adaptor subunit [Pseudomonadota bacterium]